MYDIFWSFTLVGGDEAALLCFDFDFSFFFPLLFH
jgi:hypothetical protein